VEWKQEKPSWCQHPECIFLRQIQNLLCAGQLPKPMPHDDDFNTHRICFTEGGADDEVFDLQVNKSDLYHFRRVLNAIDGR